MKKSVRRHGERRLTVVRFLLLASALIVCVFLLEARKEKIFDACMVELQESLVRGTDFHLRLGHVGGRLGNFRIRDIEISQPAPGGRRVLFECREIRLRYRLRDLFVKGPFTKTVLELHGARLHWEPRLHLRRPDLPFLVWMRRLALAKGRDIAIRADDAEVDFDGRIFGPIRFELQNNSFRAEMAATHVPFAAADVSTTLVAQGAFQVSLSDSRQDILEGWVRTEGTVVNWRPLPFETQVDFSVSPDLFAARTRTLLGEILFEIEYDPARDEVRWRAAADEYKLSNLDAMFNMQSGLSLPGTISFELSAAGDPLSPRVRGRARVRDGWVSRRSFQEMDLAFEGMVPTIKLEDSRLLLKDGTAMRLADRTIEMGDLFRERTYKSLVSDAQQDTVVWGGWELSRDKGENADDLLMKRSFGENARLAFRRSNAEQEVPGIEGPDQERNPMEVGFEYRFKSHDALKDALKLELRDHEEFVGVERKFKF